MQPKLLIEMEFLVKAVWQDEIIAQSEKTLLVDRKRYFPFGDVKMEYLQDSAQHTICPWKGKASYYDIVVNGHVNKDAAWHYPDPTQKARHLKGYLTFSNTLDIDIIEEKIKKREKQKAQV